LRIPTDRTCPASLGSWRASVAIAGLTERSSTSSRVCATWAAHGLSPVQSRYRTPPFRCPTQQLPSSTHHNSAREGRDWHFRPPLLHAKQVISALSGASALRLPYPFAAISGHTQAETRRGVGHQEMTRFAAAADPSAPCMRDIHRWREREAMGTALLVGE
jgi:hypothetical protein